MTEKIEIIPMPEFMESIKKELSCLKKNGFRIKTAIMGQKEGLYYQFIADDYQTPKMAKKPTKAAKKNAGDFFNEIKKFDLICAIVGSEKHGDFCMVSYERCPIDVIDYILATRH